MVKADEGMWLPMFVKRLNEVDMQAAGLQLTAEELYSINNSSLKDAIVSFGGFCTGEVISAEGLLLTNHHCGYGAIQDHSTVENDYLTDGFWAKDHSKELANPDLHVDFLIRMEDMTERVLASVNVEMTEAERAQAIDAEIKTIQAEATDGNDYRAQVKSFYEGMNIICLYTSDSQTYAWLEHHRLPLVNMVVIRTTGCGQDIPEISPCFEFIAHQMERLQLMRRKTFH